MGAVYEAEDTLLGRRVALKLITTGGDAEMRERMRREARTTAALEHPNVVLVFDVGEVEDGHDAGETFLAMELVRGRTLRSMVRDPGITLGKRLRWLIDVARALDVAHAAHLVHRDIKPDNVMVRDDGVIKVLDFGIAKKRSTVDPSAPTGISPDPLTLTKAGSIVGTPRYASPEQLRGDELDGGADQYSWGVTAFELLSGRVPFETDDPVALLSRVLSAEPPKLRTLDATVPEEVEAVIHKAMAKRRVDRFARLEEAAAVLEPFADTPFASGERRSVVSEAPARTPSAHVVRRVATTGFRIYFWIAAGLGTFLIVAIVAGALWGHLTFGPEPGKSATSPSAVAASPPSKSTDPLRCSDARVSGSGATPELAHLMGIGACARVAVAVGVAWTHDKAVDQGLGAERRPLDVVVELAERSSSSSSGTAEPRSGERTRVKLSLGKHTGSGESTSPLEAMQAAVTDLASRVGVAPMSAAERAEWGASTEEGGRRIERVWRRLLMNDIKDAINEAKALVKSDPDSPWSHAILGIVAQRGSKTSIDAVQGMEARLDRVSGARQRGLRALARLFDKSNTDEAMRELRKAYGDAPDDADIAGLYAAIAANVVASDEGFGVVDRLAEKFPTHALLALQNAVTAPARTDLDRDARYIARLIEVLPEARCNGLRMSHLVAKGELAEARASLSGLCARYFGTATGDFGLDLMTASVDLAAGDFDAAHDIAVRRMGDPRPSMRTEAASIAIGSRLTAGRVAEGLQTLRDELERERDMESPLVAVQHAVVILRIHRRLGTKPPADIIAWLTKAAGELAFASDTQKLAIEVHIALARNEPQKADELLSRIEKAGEPRLDVTALPLVRARKGNKAVVELVHARRRVADSAWRSAAVDAALALEATHASSAEIQDMLRYVTRPGDTGFDTAFAEAILARVYDAEGKHDEAARWTQAVEKQLAKADKGVAEAVANVK
jgi:serine/threonine protein kinase